MLTSTSAIELAPAADEARENEREKDGLLPVEALQQRGNDSGGEERRREDVRGIEPALEAAREQEPLVGYSFGADVLPFIVNRLAPGVRRDVVQVSLLGLSSRASFEFHVADWLRTAPRPDDPAVLPEAVKLDLGHVQCFYGADEKDTLCPELGRRGAEVVRTTGGHHFDGDYAALARRIRDGLARRSGRTP